MLDRTEDRTAAQEPVAQSQLRSFVGRIDRLDESIKEFNDDKKDVYAEAKAAGFDVPALKAVIAKRRKDPEKLSAHEALIDLYEAALGTPDATRAPARGGGRQ